MSDEAAPIPARFRWLKRLSIAAAVALTGCLVVFGYNERAFNAGILDDVSADNLRRDAAKLLAQRSSMIDEEFPPSAWPSTIERFDPLRVVPFMHGLLLVQYEGASTDSGLYIVTDPQGLPPSEGSGVALKQLNEAVFAIERKIRRPVRPRP